MILLNFHHPLTDAQRASIEELAQQTLTREIHLPIEVDDLQPLVPQVIRAINQIELDSNGWQTTPLLVSLSGYAPIAAALLAEIHGRSGHFPTIVRMRPAADSTPIRYEVAELINLQVVRQEARRTR